MPIFILFLLYSDINSLTDNEINVNYDDKLLDTISFDSYPDHKTPYNRTTEQDSEDSMGASIVINFSYPVFIILTFLLLSSDSPQRAWTLSSRPTYSTRCSQRA